MGEQRARGDRQRHRAPRRRVHARRLRRGLGPRRPVRRAARHLPDRARPPSGLESSSSTATSSSTRSAEDASRSTTAREEELGEELMRALERYLLLQIIDNRWREHLYDMDYLREGIHLRGFAQIEPLVAYKNEAFELFTDLMNTIWSDFARMIFHVEVEVEGAERRRRARSEPRPSDAGGSSTRAGQRHLLRRRRHAQPSALAAAAARRAARRCGPEGYAEASRRAAAGRRAAPRRRGRADRAQRPVLVRVGQEIQEVPRRVAPDAFGASHRWRVTSRPPHR